MDGSDEDGSWCTTSFEEDIYQVETNQQIHVICSKTTNCFNNSNDLVNSNNEIITVRKISSSRLLTQRTSSACTSIQNLKHINQQKSKECESKRNSNKAIYENQQTSDAPKKHKTIKNSKCINRQRWSSPISHGSNTNFPKQLLFPNKSENSSFENNEKKLQFVENIKQYCLDLVEKNEKVTKDESVIKTHDVKSNIPCCLVEEKTSTHLQTEKTIPAPLSLSNISCKDISIQSQENSSHTDINEQQTYEQLLNSLKAAQANVLQEILHKWKNKPVEPKNDDNDMKTSIEEEITNIIPSLQLPETSSSSINSNSEKESENYESSGRGNSLDFVSFENFNKQVISNESKKTVRKNDEFSIQYNTRFYENEGPNQNSETTDKMEQPEKEIQQSSFLSKNQQFKITPPPVNEDGFDQDLKENNELLSKVIIEQQALRESEGNNHSALWNTVITPRVDEDDFVQELKENNALLSKVIIEQQALRETEGNLYSDLLNTVAKNLKCSDSSSNQTTRTVPINESKITHSIFSKKPLPITRNKGPLYPILANLPQTNTEKKIQNAKSSFKSTNSSNIHFSHLKYRNAQNNDFPKKYQAPRRFISLNKNTAPRYVIKKPKSKFSSHVHFHSLISTRSSSYESTYLLNKPTRKLKRKKNTTDIPYNESENLFKVRQKYKRQTLSENDEILPQWMISYALSNSKHSLYIPDTTEKSRETTSVATQTLLSPYKYKAKANILHNVPLEVEAVSPTKQLTEKIVFDISKLNTQSLLFRIQELENEKRYIEEQFRASLHREKLLNDKLDDLFQVKQNLKYLVNIGDVKSSRSIEKTYAPTVMSSSENVPSSSNTLKIKRKNKIRRSNVGLKNEIRQLKQRILKLKKQYNKNKQQRYHPIKCDYHSAEQYKRLTHFTEYPTTSNCFTTTEPPYIQRIRPASSQQYYNEHLLENPNAEHHLIGKSNPILDVNKTNKEVNNMKINELNTRLKQTTQQVIDQCKLIKELKKNREEQNSLIENLKFRLSRSESVCHNKQLLLESYKSKLTNAISTNELNQTLKSQASKQCNIITNEMKVLDENLRIMKQRENELMKLVNQLTKDKKRLIGEINRKNSITMEELRKQIAKAINEKQGEIKQHIKKSNQLNDSNNSINEHLKKYEIGIEEFLWMVEDHLYQKYGDHDPVRKAHEMACSILHLTPTELREMFQDCHIDYSTKAPRVLDSWLVEYRKITSKNDENFPQKLAHFLYKICFSNENNNSTHSSNTSSKRNKRD